MIDLHTHTMYSDGTDTLEEYLTKAQEKNLTYVSITDHNTCRAYEKMKKINVKEYYNGKIIPGVELNTKVLGIPIEILGYNIDTNIMQKLIDENYITNEQRCLLEVKRLKERCKKTKINIPNDFVEKYDYTMWPSKYLHKIIIQDKNNKEYIDEDAWLDSNVFYRKYMSNPTTIFYIDMDDSLPTFEEASKMIKDSGGLVFIPHIYEYRQNSERILNHILENYKFDGIECYYTTFSEEQRDKLLNICDERKLLISGGSDYHGKNKKDVELGIEKGNLNIKENIIDNWNIIDKKQ
ncbi:MAG: PHP domain-containing protein [Clostridiaceae bacterium]|nr:PHP domain-containing protein [Clostridiaceae bacterium]